jgi:hypothetical protein
MNHRPSDLGLRARGARAPFIWRFGQRFGLALVAAALFGLNHLLAVTDGKISMKLVFLGSIVLGFGILAAMSPDYLPAMKARTQPGDSQAPRANGSG